MLLKTEDALLIYANIQITGYSDVDGRTACKIKGV